VHDRAAVGRDLDAAVLGVAERVRDLGVGADADPELADSAVVAAPLLLGAVGRPAPTPWMPSSFTIVIAAGLLVGFGTRLGGGCTSGHGVCGVSRASPRSIAATVAFMAAGFATVYFVRHLIGS
jgi:uncharacterized membrane protein YedE/YeeE